MAEDRETSRNAAEMQQSDRAEAGSNIGFDLNSLEFNHWTRVLSNEPPFFLVP